MLRRTIYLTFIATLFVCKAFSQVEFGAYYTKIKKGLPWEEYSRTGDHADIVVKLSKAGGKLVFW
ncbi:MAG TPA: hypothetical protein VHW43_07820, partial [Puia sp.]|nr:hypothetical protein [Puia sp.]